MIKIIEKSTIKLKPIFFQVHDAKSADLLIQSFDYVPYLYICKLSNTDDIESSYGTTIDVRDIIYVKLYNDKFLPEIEIYCNDSKNILFNDIYPFDHDTLISIFIKSNTNIIDDDTLNGAPIRMDFRVTEYQTIKTDAKREKMQYLIKGVLNIDSLHYTYYLSKNETSFNVLKDIALQMNLGFASNVTESNDKMKWINPSDTYLNFIKKITEHSFISEDSFVWTFIDFHYNLNYVNVQIELNEFDRNKKDRVKNDLFIKNDEEDEGVLYLTNNQTFKSSNKYFNKFNLVNQSFQINLQKSYKAKATWFDKDLNSIFKKTLKELENDESKLSSNEGNLKQLSDKDSKIYTENINDELFLGKVDIDNTHEKYIFAKMSNHYNFNNVEKMKMVITLNKINFFIKRFENIRIEIYNTNDVYSKNSNEYGPGSNINMALSGYWYVTGINYLYKRTGGQEQEITLVRRDLSIDYGKTQITSSDKSEKQSGVIKKPIPNTNNKNTPNSNSSKSDIAKTIYNNISSSSNIPPHIKAKIDAGLITPETIDSLNDWINENSLTIDAYDTTPLEIKNNLNKK